MRREPHVRFCERAAVRFHRATHPIVGFEHRHEAEQFLADLKARLARFIISSETISGYRRSRRGGPFRH